MTGTEDADQGLSPHPTDRLIRELVRTRRIALPDEIDGIAARMASAPFDPRIVRVPLSERGSAHRGRSLGRQDGSLFVHLVRRVVRDRQWSPETTAEQYVGDLRAAAGSPLARLAVFARRGGYLAGAVVPTPSVIPVERLGPRAKGDLWVVYSADRGMILAGYQIDALRSSALPEDAQWLK